MIQLAGLYIARKMATFFARRQRRYGRDFAHRLKNQIRRRLSLCGLTMQGAQCRRATAVAGDFADKALRQLQISSAIKRFCTKVDTIQKTMEEIKGTRLIRQKFIYQQMEGEKEFLVECLMGKESRKAMRIMSRLGRLFRDDITSPEDVQALKDGTHKR